MLRFNQPPIKNVPFGSWPATNATAKKFYLSHDNTLQSDKSDVVLGEHSYQSDILSQQRDDGVEELSFTFTFSDRTTLMGTSKAVLYMSCSDHDDMDVYVMLRKADTEGGVLRQINIPIAELRLVDETIKEEKEVDMVNNNQYLGPEGVLRASHRKLDRTLTTERWLIHDHTVEEKVSPGRIVKLEIGIWPAAMLFEAGEKLVVRISGHDMRLPDFESLRGASVNGNQGRHVLHVGGDHKSYVEVPLLEG
jgi:predicted acyl esterase